MARQIATAASGVLRDSHYVLNPVTGLYQRSTLLEMARTNLLLRSEDFSHAAWSKSNITVTADNAVAPDGNVTADKVAATATAAVEVSQGVVVAATSCTASVYGRKGTGATHFNRFTVRNSTTATNLLEVSVNWDTGVVTHSTGAGAFMEVDPAGTGWRVVLPVSAGITSGDTIVFYCAANGQTETAGNYVYLWGADLEPGACVSSYIATAGATVTRAVDNLSVPFTLTPRAMTLYAKFIERGSVSIVGARVLQIGALDDSSPRFMLLSQGAVYRVQYNQTAGSAVTCDAGAAPPIGSLVELRATLASDGVVALGQSINGAAETTEPPSAALALVSAWSGAFLSVGSINGVSAGVIALFAWKVARDVKTLAEMRALADMATAVLVLNAGDEDAITVTCQQAGLGDPTDVGERTRAFAGNLRNSTQLQKRNIAVATNPITTAQKQAILDLIANGAIIPCAGILLDDETLECSVRCTNAEMFAGHVGLWTLSLTVTEV